MVTGVTEKSQKKLPIEANRLKNIDTEYIKTGNRRERGGVKEG